MLKNLIAAAIVIAVFAILYAVISAIREKMLHKKTTFGCLGSGACANCMQQCEKYAAQKTDDGQAKRRREIGLSPDKKKEV